MKQISRHKNAGGHALNSSESDLISAILRNDLGSFIAKAFATVSPGDEYLHNWHIDAITYALMRILRNENNRLIITQPPRSLKTICGSVAFPAWAIGHNPSMRFAAVSYSHELTSSFARQFRSVVTSEWYRQTFPGVRWLKETETECVTDQGGGRVAIPMGGSLTGRGADIIVLDDPMKADDAQSEKARRAVNEWYSNTLLSRLDDKQTGAIILIMQRLHEDDLAGYLLRNGGWSHLNLPAIAEHDEDIPVGIQAIHKRRKDDVLHPEREPADLLSRIKTEMGSLLFSAQYLQRPIPLEGNLVKRAWLLWYHQPPAAGEIVQSWDIATTTGNTADWSVCTTWVSYMRQYYLLDVWRGRLEFPDLKRKLVALALTYRSNRILIEQAGAGLHLVQEFRANPVPGVPLPIGIKPKGDKADRMAAQCARFESRQVHLPKDAAWLSELLHEVLAFPNSRHDDQIDSISQFLNWAERSHIEPQWVDIGCAPKIFIGGREWHPGDD